MRFIMGCDSHEKKKCEKYDYDYSKALGKWYSWDTPIGLSLGFSITLTTVGLFIYLLHAAGIF